MLCKAFGLKIHKNPNESGSSDRSLPSGPLETIIANPWTGDYRMDVLIDRPEFRWNAASPMGTPASVTFSFAAAVPVYASAQDGNGFQPFSEEQRAAVREVFTRLSAEIDLTFIEVADSATSYGQIRFANNNQTASAGYAYLPGPEAGEEGGDVYIAIGSDTGMTRGHADWATLVHEIGHALGLKHPGNYNAGEASDASVVGNFLSVSEDKTINTIMSYRDPAQGLQNEWFGTFDLLTLRHIYGARLANTGDTQWLFDNSVGRKLQIVVDDGGVDTLDFSALDGPITIALIPGALNSVGLTATGDRAVENFTIAFGSQIENVVGTSSNDVIIGNDLANVLMGGAGNDILRGGGGNDTIDGGGGFDVALFSATHYHYRMGINGQTLTLTGPDGTDTLVRIQRLQFDEGSAIDVSSLTEAAPVNAIFRFYNPNAGAHFYTNSNAERDHVINNEPGFFFEMAAFASTGATGQSVWRFFNTQTGTHFYTISDAERDLIQATLPEFRFEGEAYKASAEAGPGLNPLYRFFNTQTGTHFFTASAPERDSVIATLPQFSFEQVAYYIDLV
jgi:hypothetical protein